MNKVFVSFDFENDRQYKYLLEAWNRNPRFQFVFEDGTPREINSMNVGRVKAALTSKVKNATHVLVIVGEHANDPHPDRRIIGHKNWINYEIHQAKEYGKSIAAVKLSRLNKSPDELLGVNASWAYRFAEPNIISALNAATPYVERVRRYV